MRKRIGAANAAGGPATWAGGFFRTCSSLLSLGALLVLAGVLAPAYGEEKNQCVSCHETERLPISLGHSFDEWRVSEHGRVNITCEKCHGGDPSAVEAQQAHVGVLPASDPKSRVHTTHIAETCGACHQAELAAYSKTVHAKQVREQQRGATCFTCHGSMAISLPSPAELKARCTVCHEKPVGAQTALALLASVKISLHRVQRTLRMLEPTKATADWYKDVAARFHDMERRYAGISLRWHAFDTAQTASESRELLHLVKLLGEEIDVRTEME